MWPNPQKTADLVIFTEEILNGNNTKNCIFCAVYSTIQDIFRFPTIYTKIPFNTNG